METHAAPFVTAIAMFCVVLCFFAYPNTTLSSLFCLKKTKRMKTPLASRRRSFQRTLLGSYIIPNPSGEAGISLASVSHSYFYCCCCEGSRLCCVEGCFLLTHSFAYSQCCISKLWKSFQIRMTTVMMRIFFLLLQLQQAHQLAFFSSNVCGFINQKKTSIPPETSLLLSSSQVSCRPTDKTTKMAIRNLLLCMHMLMA